MQKIVVVFMLVSIVGIGGGFAHPERAEAIPVTVTADSSPTSIQTAIESTVSAVADVATAASAYALEIKEYILDGELGLAIAQYTLKKITNSIINWINSGFQGSPAFVQDFPRFLLDTVNEAAGDFIYGTSLGWICSPFSIDIQIALARQQFQPFQQARCSITDIIDNVKNFSVNVNVDQFYASSFLDVGWDGWFQTIKSENNPYGTYEVARAQASFVTSRAREDASLELTIDEGFISWDECTATEDGEEECVTLTPGNIISEHLTFTLQGGQRSLLNADEINEVILALFAQLAEQALTGAAGLLGLTEGGYQFNGQDYSGRYLDDLVAEQNDRSVGINTSYLTRAINTEQEYAALYQRVVTWVNTLEEIIVSNQQCSGIPNNVPERFITERNNALTKINTAENATATLIQLRNRYNATDNPDDRFEIYNEYAVLLSNGVLHTEPQLVAEEFQIDDTVEDIYEEVQQMQNIVASCNSGNGNGGGSAAPGPQGQDDAGLRR